MTPDDQEQIDILCAQIATEQDQEKFVKLVQQLNDLLDRENADRTNPDRNNLDRESLDRNNMGRQNQGHQNLDRKSLDRKNQRIDPAARPPGSTSAP
jgi:hypothetical protein